MMISPFRLLLAVVTASIALENPAAQTPATGGVQLVAEAQQPRTVVSIQPFNAIRELYQVEAERALSNTVAVGLAGSHLSDNDNERVNGEYDLTYSTVDLKLRYYPSAKPFEGFSFAISAGYGRLVERSYYDDGFNPPESDEDTYSGATIGTFLDYGWLLGPNRRFYVAAGIGAKSLFVDYDLIFASFQPRYPTVRVSVGMGF